MKTLSSKTAISGLALVLSLSVLPLNALAVSDTTNVTTPTGFCANLSADETKVSTTLDNRLSTLNQNRVDAATKLQEERATFDSQVTTNRANWDADRQKNFTALGRRHSPYRHRRREKHFSERRRPSHHQPARPSKYCGQRLPSLYHIGTVSCPIEL
jgi:hypothetical protein